MTESINALLDQLIDTAIGDYIALDHGPGEIDIRTLISKFETILALDQGQTRHTNSYYDLSDGCIDTVSTFLPELYLRTGQFSKAEALLKKVIIHVEKNKDKDPCLYGIYQGGNYYELGMTFYLTGRFDEAIKHFSDSIRLSEDFHPYLGLALCFRKKRMYGEARSNIQSARLHKAMWEYKINKITGPEDKEGEAK